MPGEPQGKCYRWRMPRRCYGTAAARLLSRLALLAALLVVSAAPIVRTAQAPPNGQTVVVLVSANAEWKVVKAAYPGADLRPSPWGEYFETALRVGSRGRRVVFVHGGWGKVAAAGSTQYAIDRWKPTLVVNLGTCGGFAGEIPRFDVVLVDRTIIYDIREAMGDSAEAIAEYSTTIDLGWLGRDYPASVRKTVLVSADRDLVPSEIAELRTKYGAVAGDWESGAIAYTCARNRQKVLILRGVSDLVSAAAGGEAYGNLQAFEEGTRTVMTRLLAQLPAWLEKAR
jgi:adenosylhomocysteine nucleosidase